VSNGTTSPHSGQRFVLVAGSGSVGGVGVPSRYEVATLTGVYYGSEEAFIGDCLTSVVEEEGPSIKESFTPYKTRFLIKSLREVPSFNRFIEDLFIRYSIRKETSGSITLIGKDLDSFRSFYEELSAKILKPVAKELPDSRHLSQVIRQVVETRGLTQTRLE